MSDLSNKQYDKLVRPLTEELSTMARWVDETGQRLVVLFEGRDTAGKGGSIDMFARVLNPRQCHVVALSSPSERERNQWYFQRYAEHLPPKGEIALFDRSWYNRAGVEPVMGFCTRTGDRRLSARRARVRAAAGGRRHPAVQILAVLRPGPKQEERFEARLHNPLKRWKLSPIDIAARTKYEAYTEARETMLQATHTEYAPWTLVDFNDQALGRLTLLRDLLDRDSRYRAAAERHSVAAAAGAAEQGTIRRASADSRLRGVTHLRSAPNRVVCEATRGIASDRS